MKTRNPSLIFRLLLRTALVAGAITVCLAIAGEVRARVGGGQSYGGGGGHGSSGGGDAGAIVGVVRVLIWLTIEYPAVGVPVDIAVIGFVVYRFARGSTKGRESFSSSTPTTAAIAFPLGLETIHARPESVARQFAQLRKFDPNFSEIVFTDFCYALYGKAHDARGHGVAALDQFSPYLSEGARKALLERNPRGLKEVKGIIVGALTVENVGGLEKPTVNVSLLFETNYTEVIAADGKAPAEMTYYIRERWNSSASAMFCLHLRRRRPRFIVQSAALPCRKTRSALVRFAAQRSRVANFNGSCGGSGPSAARLKGRCLLQASRKEALTCPVSCSRASERFGSSLRKTIQVFPGASFKHAAV